MTPPWQTELTSPLIRCMAPTRRFVRKTCCYYIFSVVGFDRLFSLLQNLVEYIVRQKVYQTVYWKESCFALTAESLIDKAVELKAAGGTYGGQRKPTNFMCLILKMLQIQPDKEIIVEYIKNEDFKYVRLLGEQYWDDLCSHAKTCIFEFKAHTCTMHPAGAFYMRLVGRPLEVYQYLEPLYNDYRKVRSLCVHQGEKRTATT